MIRRPFSLDFSPIREIGRGTHPGRINVSVILPLELQDLPANLTTHWPIAAIPWPIEGGGERIMRIPAA